ncbi:MAG: DUF4364 family protein [Eubacteriales bacterium]|nr:DUF4364 family protein [Eubacteriales bacterium]
MNEYGLIREKLDIKLLILFVLRRLPAAVTAVELGDLVLTYCSAGYFDYTECLVDLLKSGHVSEEAGRYQITDLGREHGQTLEDSLPFTIRSACERAVAPIADVMRRSAMVGASHSVGKDGCWTELSLSDGLGDILRLRLLCANEEQAGLIEKNFRAGAEGVYLHLVQFLSHSSQDSTEPSPKEK